MVPPRLRQPQATAFAEGVYNLLLQEARHVADKTMAGMRTLQENFPEAFPSEQVEGLERLRQRETPDRRRGFRWPGGDTQIETRPVDTFGQTVVARLVDHSLSGVAIRLTEPAPVGTHLYLWAGDERDEPTLVEVRRCQTTESGWLLGCQTLGDGLSSL
jgi:hypothetical protein